MRSFSAGLFLVIALLGGASAQTADDAELLFWQSVVQSGSPAEYRAYLDAYPQGKFAPLARLRAQPGAATPPPVPAAAQPVAPAVRQAAPEAPQQASLRLTRDHVRLTDGIALDLNAEALRSGSNFRLAVVPAGTPDAIADPQSLVEDSTPVRATRLHLTIPSGPPGRDEVRLYYIPPFASAYAVGARAPVEVAPGAPGATLARELAREEEWLGPVRFDANHRDQPMLVEAAFLRVRPRTEWNEAWFGGTPIGTVPQRFVALSIGQPGVAPDAHGSLGEAICFLSAEDQAVLNRVAALQVGDPVLVEGVPTSWNSAGESDPVLLDRCSLR